MKLDAYLETQLTSRVDRAHRDFVDVAGRRIPRYAAEFWTARQRQSSSLHEISYRACFKAELPRFFINFLTERNDGVMDPFSGRGTTAVESALLGRSVIASDTNPLSEILCRPRLDVPSVDEVQKRLEGVPFSVRVRADIDLSMFYDRRTESEIVSLGKYLDGRRKSGLEDRADRWIRMVATNRLTGHSRGFFSIYTLPPNQAVSPERQRRINKRLNQRTEYRDVREIIMRKSRSLLRNVTPLQRRALRRAAQSARVFTSDARALDKIRNNVVQLTVTSPPFLNIVNYREDNWLRCWFNGIDGRHVHGVDAGAGSLQNWTALIAGALKEFYRVTRAGGWVAFEVGELRRRSVRLEEAVIPAGIEAGFECPAILINTQKFTKTANIWGVRNNVGGTNTNRIVLFHKSR